MIKKYSKLLLVFFCAFFVAITPSFAREVTLDELNDLVDETLEYSDAVSGIYIIGEYAYTSEWVLTTQDTMLAARSINTNAPGKTNKDEIYGAMTIHSYTRTTDSNWNYNGFTADKNLVGTTASADKVSIKYLDYVFIPEETKAIISSDISAADLEALKNAFGYDRTNSNTDVKLVVEDGKIKLKGFIAKGDADSSNWPEAEQTGFYFPINVKVENANDATTITYSKGNKVHVGKEDLTILYSLNPNAENKTLEIIADLDGEAVEYGPKKYVIDYSELVFEKESSVTTTLFDAKDEAFADALKNLKDAFNFNGNVGNITLKDGKFEGVVAPMEGVKGFKDDTGYYVAYVLTMPEGMTKEDLKDVKITLPADGATKVVGIEAFDTDNAIVVIHQLDPNETDKTFKVTVDLDGDGKEYTPKTLTFSYENLVFAKKTTATVSSNIPAADVTDLTAKFDFKENDTNVKLENGKLTGIISKGVANDEKFSSNPEDRTGYYYAFNVDVDGANDKTTIEINGKKTVNYTGAESLSVLFALDPKAENKVITIKVDRDGNGNEYTTETYTIDYSKLTFADEVLENAINNLMELESAKATLTLTADAKVAENSASIVFNTAFDGKTNVQKMDATVTTSNGTMNIYGWSQEKADGTYNYESDDNVNWTYTVTSNNTNSDDSSSTMLGIQGDVKVVEVAADGTITFDVLLIKAGDKVEIPGLSTLAEGEDNKEVFIPDKDVHVIIKVKDEKITEMSADLLASFADEAVADYNAISFVVTVSDLTESLVIPEDVIKNAVKETA